MTSHVPAIGGAIARHVEGEPYWKPFFEGFDKVHEWLDEARPDTVVVFYNDHGLNFFLDRMPTFAVGTAPEYRNADEGWGLPPYRPFQGDEDLGWHLVESLVAESFDIVTCQEMLVDHAFTIPLKLFWPKSCPVTTVPVCINTVQFPLPSARRCYQLGQAVGEAIRSWDSDKRVVVIGTGGLSHQLDGERAGFINKPFDLKFIDIGGRGSAFYPVLTLAPFANYFVSEPDAAEADALAERLPLEAPWRSVTLMAPRASSVLKMLEHFRTWS